MGDGGATRDLDADRGPTRDVNALCGQRAMSMRFAAQRTMRR